MPVAVNPKTGEAIRLDENGAWVPTKLATNPQTGETLALDGAAWAPIKMPKADKGLLESFNDFSKDAQGAVVQGLTGGFGDEISAAVRAGGRMGMNALGVGDTGETFGQAYERSKGEGRRRQGAFSEAYPKLSTALEVGGGIAPSAAIGGVLGGAVPAAATGVGRFGQSIAGGLAGGAATGALYGAGSGDGAEDRMAKAAQGALVGGAIGGAAAPVMQLAQPVGRKIMSAFTQGGADDQAARNFSQAMQDTGATPQSAAALVREGQSAGVPLTAAEGIGQGGRDLLDYAVNTPGVGRQLIKPAVEARQIAQPGRLKQSVADITGVDEGAATRALDASAARSATAGPQYDAMDTVPAPQRVMRALWTQLKDPEWEAAYKAAQASTGRYASVGQRPRAMPPLEAFMKGQQPLSAREVDEVLQAVKDRVDMAKGILPGAQAASGGPTGGRALNETANSIIEMMKKDVPEFAAARKAYATASSYLDGLAKGQKALAPKVTIDEFDQMFSRASAEEKRGLREGLVTAYKATIENFRRGPAADVTRDMLGKESLGEKMRIALGDADAARLMRQFELESIGSQTAGQIKNSATAFRGANKAALEGEPLGQGNFSIGGMLQRALGHLDEATSQKMRGSIARTGMEMDPAQVERLLREAMLRNPHLFGGARTGAVTGATAAMLTNGDRR